MERPRRRSPESGWPRLIGVPVGYRAMIASAGAQCARAPAPSGARWLYGPGRLYGQSLPQRRRMARAAPGVALAREPAQAAMGASRAAARGFQRRELAVLVRGSAR